MFTDYVVISKGETVISGKVGVYFVYDIGEIVLIFAVFDGTGDGNGIVEISIVSVTDIKINNFIDKCFYGINGSVYVVVRDLI